MLVVVKADKVDVILVNMPVDGDEDPIGELSIVPPDTVSPLTTIASVTEFVGNESEPETERFVEVTEVLDTLGTLNTFVVVLKVKVGVPVTVLSEFPKPTKVFLSVVVPEPPLTTEVEDDVLSSVLVNGLNSYPPSLILSPL